MHAWYRTAVGSDETAHRIAFSDYSQWIILHLDKLNRNSFDERVLDVAGSEESTEQAKGRVSSV